MKYQLTSEFKPTGDQPKAIAQLVEGVNNGEPAQVLLGATGTAIDQVLIWRYPR